MEQFLVLVILNDDRRLPSWSSIVHTRDKERKMNTFGSSNTHLDEINWCYTEWRLVFTMCVNNRYVSSHARRCEGGVYKCVRQPARIRLFKDRVMRAKSNTCTWSFLSRSAPIMREREREQLNWCQTMERQHGKTTVRICTIALFTIVRRSISIWSSFQWLTSFRDDRASFLSALDDHDDAIIQLDDTY